MIYLHITNKINQWKEYDQICTSAPSLKHAYALSLPYPSALCSSIHTDIQYPMLPNNMHKRKCKCIFEKKNLQQTTKNDFKLNTKDANCKPKKSMNNLLLFCKKDAIKPHIKRKNYFLLNTYIMQYFLVWTHNTKYTSVQRKFRKT